MSQKKPPFGGFFVSVLFTFELFMSELAVIPFDIHLASPFKIQLTPSLIDHNGGGIGQV